MTAAAAIPVDLDEPVIAPDGDRVFTFYAARDGRNLRLVRRPELWQPLPTGGGYVAQTAERVDFAPDGYVKVKAGEGMLVDGSGWLADEQELQRRGLPTGTRQRDLLTALRSHKNLNRDFFLLGAEPDRPMPIEERFIEDMTAAVGELDMEALEAMREREKATHNRPMLLTAVETSIRQVAKIQEGVDAAAKNAGPQGGGQARGAAE